MDALLVLTLRTFVILSDNLTVEPSSSDERVTIECQVRDVKIKFTPPEHFQGKLAIEGNLDKIGCFGFADPGQEVVLDVNFKHCSINKNHTLMVRITEKYKGPENDLDYQKKKGTHTSYATITCPPFPDIIVDTRFRKCPGYISRVKGWAACFEVE